MVQDATRRSSEYYGDVQNVDLGNNVVRETIHEGRETIDRGSVDRLFDPDSIYSSCSLRRCADRVAPGPFLSVSSKQVYEPHVYKYVRLTYQKTCAGNVDTLLTSLHAHNTSCLP